MTDRTLGSTTPITFFLAASSDHRSGLTGATPAVTLSKGGGAFAPADGSVSEIGDGWYALTPAGTDTDTVGDMILFAAAASADASFERVSIVAGPDLASSGIVAGPVSRAGFGSDVNAPDGTFDHQLIIWRQASGALVARQITNGDAPFGAGPLFFNVHPLFPVAPTIGDRFWIVPQLPFTDADLLNAAPSLDASPWDEQLSNHLGPGTYGQAMSILYGARGCYRIDNMTYSGSLLTAARLRVFGDPTAAQASTSGGDAEGELWTLHFSAVGSNGLPSTILGSLALLT